jgi:dihydroorotate dehydrogenase
MAVGRGGWSGPPLLDHTKKAVERIRRSVAPFFEVNACGGISSSADAAALLELGATTIQVFTALVYQGPALVKSILTDEGVRRVVLTRTGATSHGQPPNPTKHG